MSNTAHHSQGSDMLCFKNLMMGQCEPPIIFLDRESQRLSFFSILVNITSSPLWPEPQVGTEV